MNWSLNLSYSAIENSFRFELVPGTIYEVLMKKLFYVTSDADTLILALSFHSISFFFFFSFLLVVIISFSIPCFVRSDVEQHQTLRNTLENGAQAVEPKVYSRIGDDVEPMKNSNH